MQKLMSQDSLKAIIETPKKRTRVNKQIFDTSSIISKPTLKPKRRIKPFQVILTKGDKSKEIISVNSTRAIEAPPPLIDQGGDPQGSDNDSPPFPGFREPQNQQMGNPPPLVDISDNLRDGRQNSPSAQEQIESFNAIEDLSNMARIYGKGLMTVEQFIQSQANDVDIANFKRPTKTIQGIICAKTRPSNVSTTLFKPIISRNLLISYCNTLHNSPQFFHQSAPQLLRVIKRDFFIIDKRVVEKEINKCFPCLSNSTDMTPRQTFGPAHLPKGIRTHLSFDILSGLQPTSERKRYVFCVVDDFSGYFICNAAKSRKVNEIVNFFQNTILPYCTPLQIRCDQELALISSSKFKQFCSFYNIQLNTISTRFSESNSKIERMFNYVKNV